MIPMMVAAPIAVAKSAVGPAVGKFCLAVGKDVVGSVLLGVGRKVLDRCSRRPSRLKLVAKEGARSIAVGAVVGLAFAAGCALMTAGADMGKVVCNEVQKL